MTTTEEVAREQAYIDRAYACLDAMRTRADDIQQEAYRQPGRGTPQSLVERDATVRLTVERQERLDIGDTSLLFGRIDLDGAESHYIGRRGVFDEHHEPLVIDWRVPAAEPFYRATGRHPLGLKLRRHLLCEGPKLLSIEDEHFSDDPGEGELGLAGSGALLAALERARTGQMRDIVATVQSEQDQIIRDDLPGILMVQGGPGTGKTAVALHRAAYLLFTHRRQLGRHGMMVVGPNDLFMRYIEQVLPALGESGVLMTTITKLVPRARIRGFDSPRAILVKGDTRMAEVITRAIGERERPLDRDLVVIIDKRELRLSAGTLRSLIESAKRDRRTHNRKRAIFRRMLIRRLAREYDRACEATGAHAGTPEVLNRNEFWEEVSTEEVFKEALDKMWPLLTPRQLVGPILASRTGLRNASRGILSDEEREAILREDPAEWTASDMALLDEARVKLGKQDAKAHDDDEEEDDEQTYGHIVVDEVQDLSPMELRMIARRSHSGSMTIVGDLAQSIGSWTPERWDSITRHLPQRAGARYRELTINYRTPAEIMEVAGHILDEALPDMVLPRSIRSTGRPPRVVEASDVVAAAVQASAPQIEGITAIICPHDMLDAMRAAARDHTVIDITSAKGLEFDRVIVVEPTAIVEHATQGLRALYVALTRATQDVIVVHSRALPEVLQRALHTRA